MLDRPCPPTPDDAVDADAMRPAATGAPHLHRLAIAHTAIATRVFPGRSWPSLEQRTALRHLMDGECLPTRQQRPPLLLLGEPGVGKCTVASALHDASPRAHRPLRIERCEGLTVAELDRVLADPPATLVLRGVEQLSIAAQGRLLTWLMRPAASIAHPAPATRLITTSSPRLDERVSNSLFHAQLHRCIGMNRMVIRPLRERGDDLAHVATRCLQELAPRLNPAVTHLTRAALALLRHHAWPGNVRELRLAIERALIFCRTEALDTADFDLSALRTTVADEVTAGVTTEDRADDLSPTLDRPTGQQQAPETGLGPSRSPSRTNPTAASARRHLEPQVLLQWLHRCNWSVSRTAQTLDISCNALRYQIAKHGLRRQQSFLLPTAPGTDPVSETTSPDGSSRP